MAVLGTLLAIALIAVIGWATLSDRYQQIFGRKYPRTPPPPPDQSTDSNGQQS